MTKLRSRSRCPEVHAMLIESGKVPLNIGCDLPALMQATGQRVIVVNEKGKEMMQPDMDNWQDNGQPPIKITLKVSD